MKHLILTTAAVLTLATAGSALAEQAHVRPQELAVSGKPEPQSNAPSASSYAANGLPSQVTVTRAAQLAAGGGNHPQAGTDAHGTQLAAGGGNHPEADTDAHGTQLAAGGGNHPEAGTNEHGTQLAAGGGNHPEADTNAHGTQLAASGVDYVRQSHGQYA
jgi:hypothetical protein